MKKGVTRKLLLRGIAAILVAGGIYMYQNLGGAVTRATERIASEALGVPVDIGSIRLALAKKKVTVRGIKVSNPAGFRQPYVVTAESVDITLGSFSQEEINFKDITVKGSAVNLELNENGLNVLALKDLMGRKEQKQKAANETVKVVIDRMLISATKIHPSVTLFSDKVGVIDMPPLTLNGIGRGRSVTAGDAIVQIMDQYLALVARQARGSGILKNAPSAQDIQNGADSVVKSVGGLLKR